MRKAIGLCLVCLAALPALAQPLPSKYQVGSITAVKRRAGVENSNSDVTRYEISVKVDDTIYRVLYTPREGTYGVQYAAGSNLLLLVGNMTITFNDLLGRSTEVPILSRQELPPQNDLQLALEPDRYYSTKLRHLSRRLNLTADQQVALKPILEQEVGELGEIRANPVLSLENKIRKLEKIIRGSDEKLKPLLSTEQWNTLQNMRQDQKRQLRKLAAQNGRKYMASDREVIWAQPRDRRPSQ